MQYNERIGVGLAVSTLTGQTGTVVFSNSNGVSFGLSTLGNSTVLTMSASNVAGGGLAISAGTTFASTGTLVLSNSNGISFGINGQTITAGLQAVSFWRPNSGQLMNGTVQGSSSVPNLSLQRCAFALPIQATRADLILSMTAAASQAGSTTLSIALYTMFGSTASLASSTSASISWTSGTNSTTASVYGGQSGICWRSIALGTWAITPSEYLIGVMASINGPAGTTAAMTALGSLGFSAGVPGGGDLIAYFGDGVYSTGTGAFPASIHVSDVNQTFTNAVAGQPFVQLAGTF